MPVAAEVPLESVELHGRRLAYRRIGSGPVLLLVHGITNSSASWRPVIRRLADAGFTVVAPDLPGHGARSATGATTPSARTPRSCATSCRCSAWRA